MVAATASPRCRAASTPSTRLANERRQCRDGVRATQAAAPPTPDEESSDDDVPISQLRVQKYSVGDRVEADWKAGGEFFPGALAASVSELQGRVDAVDVW